MRKVGYILIVLISSFLTSFMNLNQIAVASSDDDIQVTLNCRLVSDSSEIHSSLMPTGEYDFWETPRLDTGSFDHDNSRFDFARVQIALGNTTIPNSFILDPTSDITQVNNKSQINALNVSAPKDFILTLDGNCSYESPYVSAIDYPSTSDHHDLTWCDGFGTAGNIYFLSVCQGGRGMFGSSLNWLGLAFPFGGYTIESVACTPTHIYDLSTTNKVVEVLPNGVPTGVSFTPSGELDDIESDGSTLFGLSISDGKVYEYTTTGTLIDSYDISNIDSPEDLMYDGSHWWVLDNKFLRKFDLSWNYLNRDGLIGDAINLTRTSNAEAVAFDGTYTYVADNQNDKFYKYQQFTAIDLNLTVMNFNYTILGITYSENITLTRNEVNRINDSYIEYEYFFTSADFSNYNYIYDINVPAQIITLNCSKLYLDYPNYFSFFYVNFTLRYEATQWRVPSQEKLTLNSEEIVDLAFNSGYIASEVYSEILRIIADHTIYFELNAETFFTFKFDVDVISKTYLSKVFKLLSDHDIIIDDIELSTNLNVKKIYLNNIDLGASVSNVFTASQTMHVNNIFNLEIILSDELYLPLQFIMNSLSPGTATMYLEAFTNQLTYNSINRFNSLSFGIPAGFELEHYNASFSNIKYTPDYTSDPNQDQSGSGYSSNDIVSESVNWTQRYTKTSGNATYMTNNTYSYYKNNIPSTSDFVIMNGTSARTGDLRKTDGSSMKINSTSGNSGQFVGTDTFQDQIGDPVGWTISEPSGTDVRICNVGGHKDVMELYDNSASNCYAQKDYTSANTVIEFWFRFSTLPSGYAAYMYYGVDTTNCAYLDIYNGDLRTYSEEGGTIVIINVSPSTWYRFHLEIDTSQSQFNLQIYDSDNSLLKNENYYYLGTPSGVNNMVRFVTTSNAYSLYYDAIGFTHDGYREGMNIYQTPFCINATLLISSRETNAIDRILYYSHKINTTQNVDLMVFNFTSRSWKLLNRSNNVSYEDNLNDYFNSTFNCLLKYNTSNFDAENNKYFTQIEIDELRFFYNISISNPIHTSCLFLDDTLVTVNQTSFINYNITFRFPTRIVVNQYNESIANNTFSTLLLVNPSAGFYTLTIKFIDNFSNYIIYTINYTIVSMISISIGYENQVLVFNNNTIDVHVFSENLIQSVQYHNSTHYVYKNNSVNAHEYGFIFKIRYDIATLYNISVKAVSIYNDSFFVNISNLQYIKRSTILDINLYSRYWQDQNVSAEIQLRDTCNNVLANKNVNYTIEAPNSSITLHSSKITNATGNIVIMLNLSIAYEQGFYHLNVSFSETDSYLNYWKLISFEILPIQRSVDADEINLTINGGLVGADNFIQVNHTSTLTITHLDNATFDLTIVFMLNFSEIIIYSDVLDYDFEFTATSDITSITFANATIIDYPDDFIYYFFNDAESTNYQIKNNFKIMDLSRATFYNLDNFNVKFRKFENEVSRMQITSNPSTDSSSVLFQETLIANRSFGYWYYKNVNALTINSLTLYNQRTETILNSFENSGQKYYFNLDCNANDEFTSTIDINPNWDVSFTIHENTGLYTNITMRYKADLNVTGVSVVLDFRPYSLYYENWTLGAKEDPNTFKLMVTNINFTAEYQNLTLIGTGGIPYAEVTETYCDPGGIRILEGRELDFWAYLNYTKFSQVYRVSVPASWTVYDVYYGNESYAARSITSETWEFNGTFDPSVSDSYFYFRTDPFTSVVWDLDEKTSIITITINASLDMVNCYFLKEFNPSQSHTLEIVSSDVDLVDLSDREIDGYLSFGIDELTAGTTIIKIHVRYITALEMFLQGILVFGIAGIVIAFYYKYTRDDKFRKKVNKSMKSIEKRLKRDEGKYRKIQEIQIKSGEMYAK